MDASGSSAHVSAFTRAEARVRRVRGGFIVVDDDDDDRKDSEQALAWYSIESEDKLIGHGSLGTSYTRSRTELTPLLTLTLGLAFLCFVAHDVQGPSQFNLTHGNCVVPDICRFANIPPYPAWSTHGSYTSLETGSILNTHS